MSFLSRIHRIVSGGQTGVDQGALAAAIDLGIPHGGWCPAGRRAENGVIPEQFQLRETSSPSYPQRTEKNVVDSDGTLILYRRKLSGGTQLTAKLAKRHGRPLLTINLNHRYEDDDDSCEFGQRLNRWLAEHQVQVLNVAGPRESGQPGIQDQARQFLIDAAGQERA